MDKKIETIIAILLITSLGLFAFNQFISYRYKVELIKAPCQLCAELNKNQSMCIQGCFQNNVKLFPSTIIGEWCGSDGFTYDVSGNKQEKKCNIKNDSEIINLNLSEFFIR